MSVQPRLRENFSFEEKRGIQLCIPKPSLTNSKTLKILPTKFDIVESYFHSVFCLFDVELIFK